MVKLSELRSITATNNKIEQLQDLKKQISIDLKLLNTHLSKLKSKQKCRFPCGLSVPYSEVTLVCKDYTKKGLGYEDDKDHFSEFQFYHPKAEFNMRFLTDSSLLKYEIPYEIRDHYGTPKKFQIDYGEQYYIFIQKFKEVVSLNDNDPYGRMNTVQKQILNKGFYSL